MARTLSMGGNPGESSHHKKMVLPIDDSSSSRERAHFSKGTSMMPVTGDLAASLLPTSMSSGDSHHLSLTGVDGASDTFPTATVFIGL